MSASKREKQFQLGAVVRDSVTGFEGMVTARSVHLHGCDRYWVQPGLDKEGKYRDGMWIDGLALELISKPTKTAIHSPTGGFNSRVK